MPYGYTFEIIGRVQGVYFRKYTQDKAHQLGVVGWVQNTAHGTVIGRIEASELSTLDSMSDWLKNVGSPKSKIEKSNFSKLENLSKLNYSLFKIVRGKGD